MRYKIGLAPGDRPAWDAFMASSLGGNFRQTTTWGAIRQLAGWEPVYVRVEEENGCIRAALLMFARRIPILGRTLLYGCRGPVFDWKDPAALTELMRGVRDAARQHKAIILRVDPEPSPDDKVLQDILRQAGFVSLWQDFTTWNRTQYELRLLLDRSEEEIWKSLRRTLRQEINASKRQGVTLDTEVRHHDAARFCMLMAGLEDVKNAIHHQNQYYQTVYEEVLRTGGVLVKACYAETIIAVMLLAFVGDRCWAVYMANDYTYRKLNPNKVLMWEGIRIAKERGSRFFDMGATQGKPFDPNDPLDAYKLGFRPEMVCFPGFFDYALHPLWYRIFVLSEFKIIPVVFCIMRFVGRIRKSVVRTPGK